MRLICGEMHSHFAIYGIDMDADCAAYADRIMALPEMAEWIGGAKAEPADMEELDTEF